MAGPACTKVSQWRVAADEQYWSRDEAGAELTCWHILKAISVAISAPIPLTGQVKGKSSDAKEARRGDGVSPSRQEFLLEGHSGWEVPSLNHQT